jgi:hypothetical protein
MARRANQALREAWRERIERQLQSGCSAVEFCRQEGISTASFYTWRRKLALASSAERSAAGRRAVAKPRKRPRRRSAAGTASFLELPVMTTGGIPWVELALADGTIVRVPHQNTTALLAVLRTLRGELVGRSDGEVDHA